MKAVVFRGTGDIGLEEVPEPRLAAPTDALIRVTRSAICGTDLHFVRGTVEGMAPGTILGHEAVGIVEELGEEVRNLREGDRVVVASTIACGACAYCRDGLFSQCDTVNPSGGTAYFGGPPSSGSFPGLQAERARIPFAHVGLVKLDERVSDAQGVLLSDIFPTGYFAAELAHVHSGRTVAVFGCGPVGQFAIASAKLLGAGRIFAIDNVPTRLDVAREQGAETIDFDEEDPVAMIREMTNGIGVDRAIDAVGIDAMRPRDGSAATEQLGGRFDAELAEIAPGRIRDGAQWSPGDAPSLVFTWAIEALAKGGTLSIVGVYPPSDCSFPIGLALGKNLSIRAGNCDHRRYIPMLMEKVATGVVDPVRIAIHTAPLTSAIDAYHAFDAHRGEWLKPELQPNA